MKIIRIETDNEDYKIIAACTEKNLRHMKPVTIGHAFFDWKDGLLREFKGHEIINHSAPTFKDALCLILNMGNRGYNMAFNVLSKYGSNLKVRLSLSRNNCPVS